MKLFGKLLLRKLRPFQLVIALAGTLIGLTMLLAACQFYSLFGLLLQEEKDVIGNQYLIVQKKISLLNTFSISNSEFSGDEIEDIARINGVNEVATFRANLFRANAFVEKGDNQLIPQLYTELFFESVPDNVIDIKTEEWKWPSSDSALPLILPKDYLNLYNFGFAPGQNLPQISESSIRMLEFKIRVQGNGKSGIYKAFIAGFSNRINSILVPDNFLIYANKVFGDKKETKPSRLIVVCNDASSQDLFNYLKESGLETNEEMLKSGRLNSILNIMISIVSVVGFIIIFLAVMNIIQYAQLLITQSDYEIRTLILLGYFHQSISWYYARIIFLLMLSTCVLAYLFLFQISGAANHFLSEKGYSVQEQIFPMVHLCAALLIITISAASSFIVHWQIRKIARNCSGK